MPGVEILLVAYLYWPFNHRVITVWLQYAFEFHCTTTLESYELISFFKRLFFCPSLPLKIKRGLHLGMPSAETFIINVACRLSHPLR